MTRGAAHTSTFTRANGGRSTSSATAPMAAKAGPAPIPTSPTPTWSPPAPAREPMKQVKRPIIRHGRFTLDEVMSVMLILALLSAAAAWSFAQPLARARTAEAVELVTSFDASSRLGARQFGRGVDMIFDLTAGTLERREGERTVYRGT